MTKEPEFRIGDVTPGRDEARRPTTTAKLDGEIFPTLTAFIGTADFRQRLDELAGEARAAKSTEIRSALQTAVRLLPVLRGKFGG
jgi:hypothetical protein